MPARVAEKAREGARKMSLLTPAHSHGKYCSECKTDVADAWRVKNKEGLYFCRPCAIQQYRIRRRGNPPRPRLKIKRCLDCGTDVMSKWRIKNQYGEYFCEACYIKKTQMPEIDAIPSASAVLFESHRDDEHRRHKKPKKHVARDHGVAYIRPRPIPRETEPI